MTTKELSKKSGVPIGTLNKILADQTSDPKFETVKAICKALNISLADLDDYERKENHTIAAHFDGDEFTEEQIEKIKEFAEFIKSNDKK